MGTEIKLTVRRLIRYGSVKYEIQAELPSLDSVDAVMAGIEALEAKLDKLHKEGTIEL